MGVLQHDEIKLSSLLTFTILGVTWCLINWEFTVNIGANMG